MKKTILIISALALIFSLNIAFAKNELNGQPFQAIWDAIDDLYEKIVSIELLPGPQGQQGGKGDQGFRGEQGVQGEPGKDGQNGEDGINCWDLNGNRINEQQEDINGDGEINTLDCKGDKGDKGVAGEQGIQGINGKSFRLVDGNNQDLGVLLDAEITMNERFVSYLENQDIIMGFYSDVYQRKATAIMMGNCGMLYYKEANCKGNIYCDEVVAPHKVMKMFGSKYFKASNNSMEAITSYSRHSSSGVCENLPAGLAKNVQLIHEISLPFTEPLAYPLEIISQ